MNGGAGEPPPLTAHDDASAAADDLQLKSINERKLKS